MNAIPLAERRDSHHPTMPDGSGVEDVGPAWPAHSATASSDAADGPFRPRSAGTPGMAIIHAEAGDDQRHALAGLLAEIWRHRELLYFLALRDIKLRYKQTVFGILWAVMQPLFTMAVFVILFGRLAKLPTDGIAAPIFYLSALVPWIYFSTTISSASTSLVANSEMVTKIYFPRILLPISVAIGGALDLVFSFSFLLLLMLYYGVVPTPMLLLWPVLVVGLAGLAVSVGTFLSALNVKYRDVRYVLPFLVQLWMFATPIIYPAQMLTEHYRWLLYLNPLSGFIVAFRSATAGAGSMDWLLLAGSLAETGLLLAVALRFFKRTERGFADHV